jgi:deazaflavin-dependent oxidoreductase (nitroreductase family)
MGYASRTLYRRGSWLRRQVNRGVAWLAGFGLTPSNTVRLEVAGRKTGRVRAFAVTLAILDNECYLVSLAGESDWVRNLRAAGTAVIRHGRRNSIRVEELAVEDRALVLDPYLSKRALSKSPATAARNYFGVGSHPSRQVLRGIAVYYPVFKVIELP